MFSPRFGAIALAALALVGPAYGQPVRSAAFARPQIIPFPVNPNQYIAPNLTARQLGFNIATLGQAYRQVPPYLFGYNPYPPPIFNTGPIVPAIQPPLLDPTGVSPYALSTFPGAGLAGGGTLSTSPYSLSTVPGGLGGYGGYGGYGYGGYIQDPYSSTIQGIAALTSATGQYYVNIQQARILREQSRQMSLETQRQRMRLQLEIERNRPTAPKLAAQLQATELEFARRFASDGDITSGRALNTLLGNLPATGLNRGETVPLDGETLKLINLSGGSSSGSLALIRDGVKESSWPEALQDKAYEDARKALNRDLNYAVDTIKGKAELKDGLLRGIRKEYKAIADRLSESADDLDAGQYIAAKRFLNQLKSAIDALGDPKAANYFGTWTAQGKTVSELVGNMKKTGLTFAPASPGDEAAYRALYLALRAFDASMQPRIETKP